MISHQHQCIFVHIPKNAGASIEKIIWPNEAERSEDLLWMGFKEPHRNAFQTGGLQHLYARNILKAVGQKTFDRYFKFTIVRNPWDKAVSQYLYLQKRWDLRQFLRIKRHASFKEYLDLIRKNDHVHWAPQINFILDQSGNSMVDFVGRFENYENDVRSILKNIKFIEPGGTLDIPHINKTKRKPYWVYYDDESIEMVREIYSRDIEYFDYRFDYASYNQRAVRLNFPVPQNWLEAKWANAKDRFK